ncbi:hypothetical protein BTO04_12115 [Polaribacter sp. SA4-10]|uniref:hypothetical protein n=1 Tax=Polaribacter sp. SA4-10 TaxID=754397 RepID=UPI000B3CB6BF|nr:hypothetical protein [Polaribacter sp. SA4-10]ARV08067.1 hypothetical protein BTO04_12115 [Polaribacter sp. SA4-10]
MKRIVFAVSYSLFLAACSPSKFDIASPVQQESIHRVEEMPNLPQPFKILDFNEIAKNYDKLVYDPNQTGEYWPLIWKDNSRKNFDQETFGIYTAMGDVRQGNEHYEGIFHESLASIGSVLGGSLVGINKSNQNGENYVGMLKNYFNSETKWNIMMNNTSPEVAQLGGGYARDWWYDVYPNVMLYAVADFYPEEKGYEPILRSVADKFYEADAVLDGNYDYSFFNYATMKPTKNWICAQEDVAAGHAYVLYSAYQKFQDPRYLEGAKSSLEALLNQKENRFYEILMPFGAYVAARMNAEQGTNYDFSKILDWTFDGSSVCREGWGVLVDNWNGYDVSGIVGSTVHNGGFGFLMNTFDTMWPLVPMVRYDQRYANSIGKWMLNAANASRLFYPNEIPDEHQTIPEEKVHTKGVIAYEALIKKAHYEQYEHLEAPVAIGDGMHWNKDNPKVSQFSVYGSGHVGIAGAIISKTNVENILQLDLLATDFYKEKAYPSYLYYNPNPEVKEVIISTGEQELMIYDAMQRAFIAKNITGSFTFKVDKENSSLLVLVPQDAEILEKDGKLYANDTVIDFRYSKVN